jgi:hypothetical protein
MNSSEKKKSPSSSPGPREDETAERLPVPLGKGLFRGGQGFIRIASEPGPLSPYAVIKTHFIWEQEVIHKSIELNSRRTWFLATHNAPEAHAAAANSSSASQAAATPSSVLISCATSAALAE